MIEEKEKILHRFRPIILVAGIVFVLFVYAIHLYNYVYYLHWLPYIFIGAIDGLNVCSLAIMALIISLMYNVNAERKRTLFLGTAYISGVFISYFLIGLGLLIISLPLPTHVFTQISVAIMLSIGVINIINYIYPSLIPSNPVQVFSTRAIKKMRALTFPSVLAAGILVGLHNLPCPCTMGIYMTSISIIAENPLQIIHLISYNFGYVIPLILILYVCSNKSLSLKFRRRYAENTRKLKLVLGILMVLLSLIIISVVK